MEPGRSLLDGCGMTVARVEFRKQRSDGDLAYRAGDEPDSAALDLGRLPRRSAASPAAGRRADRGDRGLPRRRLLHRARAHQLAPLRFPEGVAVGDLVAFPNTAGYLMHILESASHQIPLARNLVVQDGEASLDPIDAGDSDLAGVEAVLREGLDELLLLVGEVGQQRVAQRSTAPRCLRSASARSCGARALCPLPRSRRGSPGAPRPDGRARVRATRRSFAGEGICPRPRDGGDG